MIDPARPTATFRRPGREGSVPRVADPWAEDGDQLRAAKGITLGAALSLGVWTLVALVVLLVLAVLA
jgi:hypothetical protein